MRNDDPCALSDVEHECRVLSIFQKHGVPHVAAVIPRVVSDPHDDRAETYYPLHENPAMLALLKEYLAKDGLLTIAQHGDVHQTNRFRPSRNYNRDSPDAFDGIAGPWLPFEPACPEGYSEFDGLPFQQQREKILHGKAYLEKLFGVQIDQFVFPWNSYNQDSLRVLREAGFRYVLAEEGGELSEHGLFVLGACYWWGLGEDEFTELVEDALEQEQSCLLHLSFHSWMLKEEDLQRLDAFLARFSDHPEIVFITPERICEIPAPVKRYLALRRAGNYLRNLVAERLWLIYPHDHDYYLFSTGHYLKRLNFFGGAVLICKTLGLAGWMLASLLLALGCLFLLIHTWGRWTATGLCAGLALVLTGFILYRTRELLVIRRRQHHLWESEG